MAEVDRLDVSIVIPVTRVESACDLMESLRVSILDCGVQPCETIVVTNKDGASRVAGIPSCYTRVVTCDTRGASFRRNLGARSAIGEWILFMDDDVMVDSNFMRALYLSVNSRSVDVVQGVAWRPKDTDSRLARIEAIHYSRTIRRDWRVQRRGQLDPRVLLMQRRTALRFPFDEALPYGGEGHDLMERVLSAGLDLRLDRNLEVRHGHRTTIAGAAAQRFGYGLGRAQYWMKSHSWEAAWVYWRRHYIWTSGVFLRGGMSIAEWSYSVALYSVFWLGFIVGVIAGMWRATFHLIRGFDAPATGGVALKESSASGAWRPIVVKSNGGQRTEVGEACSRPIKPRLLAWTDVSRLCGLLEAQWGPECVDLLYCDPPYDHSDCDVWSSGVSGQCRSYIEWLGTRLERCRCLVNPRGSIWVHARPRFAGLVRELCDEVFPEHPFVAEIRWQLNRPLYLSRTGDEYGVILCYGTLRNADGKVNHFPKRWGNTVDPAVWGDIPVSFVNHREASYWVAPAKPRKLLQRIVELGSRRGEVVLDCFTGTGVVVEVAHRGDRKWLSCDTRLVCIAAAIERLKKMKYSANAGGEPWSCITLNPGG